MTTNAEHAARNQQVLMLALAFSAARAIARNRLIVLIGVAGVAIVAHRKGAAASAALKRWAADNMDAWRRG
jgi:hypothetical protein